MWNNHIVALSGGKDSVAMAVKLQEIGENEYIFFCTPTGEELPEMLDHWMRLEDLLGQEIIRLKHPDYAILEDIVHDFEMLPNWRSRWCTRLLKIETAIDFYKGFENPIAYVGLRADEEIRGENREAQRLICLCLTIIFQDAGLVPCRESIMVRRKSTGGIAKTRAGTPRKVGSTFTKTISKGPNKGDRVKFKVAPSGKPYPKRVVNDKGGSSTLKNNPGVKFGKKK